MSFYNSFAKYAIRGYCQPALSRSKNLQNCIRIQEQTLRSLLRISENTKFGLDHQFSKIRTARDYQKQVKLRTYEQFFKEYFLPASIKKAHETGTDYNPERTSPFLDNIIWPGLIRYFSLSSGTTSGSTKFIPLTQGLLKSNQKASLDTAFFHFSQKQNSKIFGGRTLLLGGSPVLRKDWQGKVMSGDLSGIIIHDLPFFFRRSYFPGVEIASIPVWEEKIDRIAKVALRENLSLLSGVPTWILLFLEKLNQKKQFKGDIKSLWPDFELFVHGGVSFEPYRKQFEEWMGPNINFLEVYPASEAFIAIEDPQEGELRLMVDYGTFYEFVPVEELSSQSPTRHTIADVEIGKNYAVILTTNGGLWSYVLGDTIRFLSKEPLLLKITGRTKFYLSAFGEHLIQEEIESALNSACKMTDASYSEYHVAPVYPDGTKIKGQHQYLIEFTKQPRDLKLFSDMFDKGLQKLNEDYAQHRSGGFGMEKPEFIAVPNGFFKEWMRKKGKLGGQHKVPRISSNRELISDMLNDLLLVNQPTGKAG